MSLLTHVAGHARALENTARRRTGTDRTGRPMPVGLTVRLRPARESVTANAALETLALGDTRDVDKFILGENGLGGKAYPAPQASLMAILAKGIVGGDMAWPLIIVGILMAVGLILLKVKSPMLVCVGMYLPLETSFAIFIGGLI